MGFLTKEDFELLSQWGGKDYDKNNPKHKEALRKLGEVYQKIKEIGVAIYQDKFKITKHPLDQAGGKGLANKLTIFYSRGRAW